ncbi:MAG: hypothetical protein WA943_08945 [Parvibaculum sp.]|jgi:hypothetical protein|uniref:hypothetical protein n=1 Tax=Parvibaculum sp. TaxID=2024848 RepID=UPI003C754944
MMRGILKPLAGVAVVAIMLTGQALAAEPETTAAPAGAPDQSYEIHDPADTPPVNFRSGEDARYNTKRQHDAEMYAEEYEKKRAEKAFKERQLLDNMNKLSSPGGPINGDFGARDAGFPPRAPY